MWASDFWDHRKAVWQALLHPVPLFCASAALSGQGLCFLPPPPPPDPNQLGEATEGVAWTPGPWWEMEEALKGRAS